MKTRLLVQRNSAQKKVFCSVGGSIKARSVVPSYRPTGLEKTNTTERFHTCSYNNNNQKSTLWIHPQRPTPSVSTNLFSKRAKCDLPLHKVFSSATTKYNPAHQSISQDSNSSIPTIFQSPGRYIQKAGVMPFVGDYLRWMPGSRVGLVGSKNAKARFGSLIQKSFSKNGKELVYSEFQGESSWSQIHRIAKELTDLKADYVLGLGGGKTADTAKAVARVLQKQCVVVPTLASNDSPCSALSIIYTDSGEFQEIFYYPENPQVVIVDTQVIADAPKHFLVAGIGDAWATFFEARVCAENPSARNEIGGRPNMSALALSRLCHDLLLEKGKQALKECDQKKAGPALEIVVEACTLLSGLGFESGGLAGAHGLHNSLTLHPATHSILHGEKVAFCTLIQLALEEKWEDFDESCRFFSQVGLPTTLTQLGVNPEEESILRKISENAVQTGNATLNIPIPNLNAEKVFDAILSAHNRGLSYQ